MRCTGNLSSRLCMRSALVAFVVAAALALSGTAHAADPTPPPSFPKLAEMLRSVVKVRAFALPDAESAKRLGTERTGNGIVVGPGGLIVTIGYLITESMSVEIVDERGRTRAASVIGYDAETGLGLLRAPALSALPPLPLGNSTGLKSETPVAVAAAGGTEDTIPAVVVSRRPFAGSWEYLLEAAIYTAPAHPDWSGAALISTDGKLLGIGSLLTAQARRDGEKLTGNVFVPVDLRPLLAEIAETGKVTPRPHPWLGLNATAHPGGLVIGRLSARSPAQAAGLERGDLVTAVGGRPVDNLADFYRRMWAMGSPGIDVPLTVVRDGRSFSVKVRSASRYQFLAKEKTY
jgi:S1-C subfamily serine protease